MPDRNRERSVLQRGVPLYGTTTTSICDIDLNISAARCCCCAADGADGQAARFRLCPRDHILHAAPRRIVRNEQRQVEKADRRDWRKVTLHVERQLAKKACTHGVGIAQQQHRVTIGLGVGHRGRADDRSGAGPVVDHDGLPQRHAHLFGHRARGEICDAAGAERHDQRDRAARVGALRSRAAPRQHQGQRMPARQQEVTRLHARWSG